MLNGKLKTILDVWNDGMDVTFFYPNGECVKMLHLNCFGCNFDCELDYIATQFDDVIYEFANGNMLHVTVYSGCENVSREPKHTTQMFSIGFFDDDMNYRYIAANTCMNLREWVDFIINAYDLSEMDIHTVGNGAKTVYKSVDLDELYGKFVYPVEPIKQLDFNGYEYNFYPVTRELGKYMFNCECFG